jgi:hypothetical protein
VTTSVDAMLKAEPRNYCSSCTNAGVSHVQHDDRCPLGTYTTWRFTHINSKPVERPAFETGPSFRGGGRVRQVNA